jgi:hypothetical protein
VLLGLADASDVECLGLESAWHVEEEHTRPGGIGLLESSVQPAHAILDVVAEGLEVVGASVHTLDARTAHSFTAVQTEWARKPSDEGSGPRSSQPSLILDLRDPDYGLRHPFQRRTARE